MKSRYVWVPILLFVSIPSAVWLWWELRPEQTRKKAEEAMALGYWADADLLAMNALLQDVGDAETLALHALILARLQRADEALSALRQALKLGVAEAEGKRLATILQAHQEMTPATEKNLHALLLDNPKDAEALFALAEGFARAGRWKEAEELYTRVIELEPERIEARLARGRNRRASAYEPGGRMADAFADFDAVLKEHPNHFEARLQRAECYLADARLAEARAELLICRNLRVQRPEPLVGLAHCSIEEQDWTIAEQQLDAALQLDPKSLPALTLKGDLCLRLERHAEAIDLYQGTLKLDPRNAGVHLKLAQALHAAGRREEAGEHEQAYRRLKPP